MDRGGLDWLFEARKLHRKMVSGLTCLALAAGILVLSGCSGVINSPSSVANSFIAALAEGSNTGIDSLVKWDAVMIRDFYVTEDFYKAQEPAKQLEVMQGYKNKFFSDYFPFARKGTYLVKRIAITRGISDAGIQLTFPQKMSADGKTSKKLDFTIRMKLEPEKKRWSIIDFGDLTRLQILDGDFTPGHFYLTEPVKP